MTGVEELVEWIDPDGAVTLLDVDWDTFGRGMPPIAMEEDSVPEQPGSRLRGVRHLPRDWGLPLWITASTPAGVRTSVRNLIATMDPTRGDGRVRITTAAGDQREIVCRYRSGLELVERLGETSGPLVQRGVAIMRSHDPYWYDPSPTVTDFGIGAPSSWFPFFPLRLGTSELFTDASVNNAGDVDVWPVWEIQGPGADINLKNLTTGKTTTLSINLGSGGVIIDTRPGRKSVKRAVDGTNLFTSLSNTSSLWPLRRGVNAIRIEMSLATTASKVSLSRKHAYLSV